MEIHDDGCVLSEDNIYEILTRVDLVSLPSCISVCKAWRRIAYQSNFGEAHSHRTTKSSGFILETESFNKYHHTFVSMHGTFSQPFPPCRPQTLYIEATAPIQGLLFCGIILECKNKNDINTSYYIMRIGTTPYSLPIPNPDTRFDTSGVAIICDTHYIKRTSNEFKIVRISEPRWGPTQAPSISYCEIFDPRAQKWKRSNDLPYLWFLDKNGIVIKQTAYWKIKDLHNPVGTFNSSFSIFAFNVEEEKGLIITKPETKFINCENQNKWRIIPFGQWLCLVHMSDNNINVWMLMVTTCDDNIQQWEWKGSYSAKYIKNHKFAFGDGIPNEKVVFLETLYRELWFYLHERVLGAKYMYPLTLNFKMYMDGNF